MFTSSSAVTASIWGLHGTIGDPNTAGTSAFGGFTPLTLAPNGYLYGAPRSVGINSIMVVDPGNANSPSTNYSVPTVTFVQAGTSGDRPAMPNATGIDTITYLYNSKGVLAPNGFIYYAPHTAGVTEVVLLEQVIY
jgi:hypothetical protein